MKPYYEHSGIILYHGKTERVRVQGPSKRPL